MAENPYSRPTLVTIVGILYALLGLGLLIAGLALAFANIDTATLIDAGFPKDLAEYAGTLGILCAVLGVIYLIITLGFFKGWSIMWYLGIIFSIIGIVASIAGMAQGVYGNIISLIINVVIIYYLFRPNVKLFFLKHE